MWNSCLFDVLKCFTYLHGMWFWQRSLSNGKPVRKIAGVSSGNPSSSSRRGSDKRRISTTMVLMFINTFSFFIMEKAINAYATSPFIDREKLQCHSFGPHKGCFSKVYAQNGLLWALFLFFFVFRKYWWLGHLYARVCCLYIQFSLFCCFSAQCLVIFDHLSASILWRHDGSVVNFYFFPIASMF